MHEYGIELAKWNALPDSADAIVAAVSHKEYLAMSLKKLTGKLKPKGVFVDVKSAYDPKAIGKLGFRLWRV
jgi:UDP-N-acetyl-D-galactosamine dehydrogenase